MLVQRPSLRVAQRSRGGFTLLEVLVVAAILLILAGSAAFATIRYLAEAKISQANLQMQKIEQACKTYYTLNDGNWPTSAQELIVPTQDGKPPLLEGGQSAITNPFTNKQQYNIDQEVDSVGALRVVVWTTDDNGNRLQWPKN